MLFQKIIVYKIHPGVGGRGLYKMFYIFFKRSYFRLKYIFSIHSDPVYWVRGIH